MIVYPYLEQNKRLERGTKLAVGTSSFMYFYCIFFSVLALGSS